jgi:hypothetical protein
VILRRIYNFIKIYMELGKYILCERWWILIFRILVGYWKKNHIVLSTKNSMRDFRQNVLRPYRMTRNEYFKSGFMIFGHL